MTVGKIKMTFSPEFDHVTLVAQTPPVPLGPAGIVIIPFVDKDGHYVAADTHLFFDSGKNYVDLDGDYMIGEVA